VDLGPGINDCRGYRCGIGGQGNPGSSRIRQSEESGPSDYSLRFRLDELGDMGGAETLTIFMSIWRRPVYLAAVAIVCYFVAAAIDYQSWQVATVFALGISWLPLLIMLGIAIYMMATHRLASGVKVLAFAVIGHVILALFIWQDIGQVFR
jgi:hypothetical protein